MDIILPIFDPHPSLRGRLLYPELAQEKTFFDSLHFVHVVIEWPLWLRLEEKKEKKIRKTVHIVTPNALSQRKRGPSGFHF